MTTEELKEQLAKAHETIKLVSEAIVSFDESPSPSADTTIDDIDEVICRYLEDYPEVG